MRTEHYRVFVSRALVYTLAWTCSLCARRVSNGFSNLCANDIVDMLRLM